MISVAPTTVLTGDASTVGEIRRRAASLARQLGLDEETTGRVALVATELAGNVVKHAGGDGWCQIDAVDLGGRSFLRLICADAGPGIADVASALRNGYSTRATPGTGLGAVLRSSQRFDLYSSIDGGTVVTALLGAEPLPDRRSFDHAGVVLRKHGQEVSGDAWAIEEEPGHLWVLVADGLGHGPSAADAAERAVGVFHRTQGQRPAARVAAIHEGLRASRGAAVAVAEIDAAAGVLRYAGIGNVSGLLLHRERRALVSTNGTAGHHARSVREFDYPCPGAALLVMHSDGVSSRWDFADHPGLVERDPATIAAVLVQAHGRGRDDAGVAVARRRA